VIATHNSGKLREIGDLLSPYGIEVQSAAARGLPDVEETGTTFLANARIKAMVAAAASGLPALADDSGLVVDALGGAPGVYSARWAGPKRDFGGAMQKIEDELRARGALDAHSRSAHFACALSVAWPDAHVEEFEGRIDGTIVWPPRGGAGFGYDPIFLPDGFHRTFGEMTAEEKHGLLEQRDGLSHRARAFGKLAAACLRPLTGR
jgi:XTP/dITP diphosphohydrolase